MDKNFKVRMAVGLAMFIVAIIGLYTFDSIPFKIIYGLFSLMSLVELISFYSRKCSNLEMIFVVCGVIFVSKTDLYHFWYIILGVPGYDIFAYLFGRVFGGKVFGKSRPFPKISKNKTWEGTILGLAMAMGMVTIMMAVNNRFDIDWYYLFCGPLALVGDLFESYLKRQFKIKDSNEVVIRHKFFRELEHLVGGSEGHGGFLDRVDSTAFTTTIILIIGILVGA